MREIARIRVSEAAAKYGEHAPVATACCNACRACVTSNIAGITLGVLAAAGTAIRRRFARPAALTDR